jgi:uncharacterized protein (DUF1697 family)
MSIFSLFLFSAEPSFWEFRNCLVFHGSCLLWYTDFMKYVALLRGINVGGNSIIKMTDLKEAVEKCGFTGVITFIQSGNVIFESDEINNDQIVARLADCLLKYFKYDSSLVVRSLEQFTKIVSEIPTDWEKSDDLRRYLAFIAGPLTAQDVIREISLKEGIDSLKLGTGVLYMSTKLRGLSRSGFTKLINTKVYRYITIRNFNTVQKLLAIMEAKPSLPES